MEEIESLRRLTEAVEATRTDIAPTYAEYVQLAFAIATDCGEAGRDYFHRLCHLSAKYQREHAERMFSKALSTGNGEVHLGTVFHLAEMAGVTFVKERTNDNRTEKAGTVGTPNMPLSFSTHAHVYNNVSEDDINAITDEPEELLDGSEPLQPLPTFPEVEWPKLLMLITSHGTTKAQRDVLLLGAFTALGATMERNVRCPYAGKYQSPNLQTFIIALAASGKGVLSLIRLLVEPIHDEIRREVEEEMKAYQKEKMAYEVMGKDRAKMEAPQMPKNRMFLISGNNTGTGILQNIMDSNGTGLICETEADTISSAIGSDYGHWSDTLRKAFDHDRLSYNRRTNEEYREVKKTYLSVLLSGTPAQVKPLIPSAENGLFSRELFYYMPGIRKWINQFAQNENDLEMTFTNIGLEWKKKVDLLKKHGIHTLRLTEEQKAEFNALFADLFVRSSLANGNEMCSSVARLAVNTCRIMTEIAVLRVLENPHPYQYAHSTGHTFTPDKTVPADNIKDDIITRWDVTIDSYDFKAVLSLVTPLYCHSTHILSFLPSTEINRRTNTDRDVLFNALGEEFTRTQMLEQAAVMQIKPNTALTWLKRLVKKGLLVSVDGKGTYTRTHVCV